MYFRYVLALAMVLGCGILAGQKDRISLVDLSEGERKSIEAVALYPEEIRNAVLEVASHPAVMVKLKRLQESSKVRFQELLQEYSRDKQELIWDLSRFDPLLAEIALSDRSLQELQNLAQPYPEEVAKQVLALNPEDFILIENVVHLKMEVEEAAFQLIESEDPGLLDQYDILLENPEVLDIMFGEMDLAILVGDLYRTDRKWVMQKADSLNLALAAQNSRDLEDWKKALSDDPEARRELLASMGEYAEEYPFDDVYYDQNADLAEMDEREVYTHISEYYFYHYPFWFGYPYWYEYPRWIPYPIWYEWGFYPRHRTIIVFNLPRYHTIWWYFSKPQHHYRYTHLSRRMVEYRNTHREHGSSISSAVNRWQSANREIISDEFLTGRNLENNLKLYGQMEEARSRYNDRNPSRPLTSSEYAERNQRKYQAIRTIPRQKSESGERVREQILKDIRNIPSRTPVRNKAENKEQIRKVDRAKEYHRNQTVNRAESKKSEVKPSPNKRTVEPVKKQTTRRKNS